MYLEFVFFIFSGKSAYALKQNIEEIQREIMAYGSVVTGFTVYTDFHYYKRGTLKSIFI